MSKGSNRRPGSGYADGYDGIDWGKKDAAEMAKPHVRYFEIDIAIQKYGTYPRKVWNIQADGSLLPADGGAPLTQFKPTRITGNFRCKVNGMDMLNDAGFELLTQPGFDYVLEAIEPQAKTCQLCKHWRKSLTSPLDSIAQQTGRRIAAQQDGIVMALVRERVPEWQGDIDHLRGRLVGLDYFMQGYREFVLDGVPLVRFWKPEIDWSDGREMHVTQKYAVLHA